MTEQKCLLVGGDEASLDRLNSHLSEGWQVSSIVAQRVATGSGYETRGYLLVLLQRFLTNDPRPHHRLGALAVRGWLRDHPGLGVPICIVAIPVLVLTCPIWMPITLGYLAWQELIVEPP